VDFAPRRLGDLGVRRFGRSGKVLDYAPRGPRRQTANEPITIITDPAEVGVSTDEEIKRFRIAIRPSSQFGWMRTKVSDGGTRRIRHEVAKAGDGAYYQFDYETQEAVIYRPTGWQSLADWMQDRGMLDNAASAGN
jgi:hypothetical protein